MATQNFHIRKKRITANNTKYIKVALISTNKHLQPLIEKYIENTLNLLPYAQQKLFNNMNEAKIWLAS